MIDLNTKKEAACFVLYVHINKINGKKYVGITSIYPPYRWKNGNGYIKNKHFYAAIQKYGWDNFEHRIIIDNMTEEQAKTFEKFLIKEWKTQDKDYGYNLSAGGEGTFGYKMSEEQKMKISEKLKGRTFSEETRKKFSENCPFARPEVRQRSIETRQRAVIARTLDGEFVGKFPSCKIAAQELGLTDAQRCHITECCKGKTNRTQTGGYKWEYAS